MCEGLLRPGSENATCIRCGRILPMKELKQVLKLLRVANYKPASEQQQGPTEDEKRNAVNRAALKLARLKLKVTDLEELQPPPPPAPTFVPRAVVSTSSWTTTSNSFGGFYVRIVVR